MCGGASPFSSHFLVGHCRLPILAALAITLESVSVVACLAASILGQAFSWIVVLWFAVLVVCILSTLAMDSFRALNSLAWLAVSWVTLVLKGHVSKCSDARLLASV